MNVLRYPTELIQVVKDLYTEASMMIQTGKNQLTKPVLLKKGVKQGCPLSPLLFNLCIQPMLERLNEVKQLGVHFTQTNTLINNACYADDLVIFAQTETGIFKLHQIVANYLNWTNISIDANKSACLVIDYKNKDKDIQLRIRNQVIPIININEAYKYLGVPVSLWLS